MCQQASGQRCLCLRPISQGEEYTRGRAKQHTSSNPSATASVRAPTDPSPQQPDAPVYAKRPTAPGTTPKHVAVTGAREPGRRRSALVPGTPTGRASATGVWRTHRSVCQSPVGPPGGPREVCQSPVGRSAPSASARSLFLRQCRGKCENKSEKKCEQSVKNVKKV